MAIQILIAEDEAALRAILAEGLDPYYKVLTAGDGREALALLQSDPGIQLLLTDIRMPNMNGFELAEQALRLLPELKILFMSGFADALPPSSVLLARELRTLPKPFEVSRLIDLVDEMLARP